MVYLAVTASMLATMAVLIEAANQSSSTDLTKTKMPEVEALRPVNYEYELVKMLLTSAGNKLIRPQLESHNSTIIIRTRLYLVRIQHIVEASEMVHSTIRLQLNWEDQALQWSPDDYGGKKDVVIPGGRLWVPDLHIANSVDFAEDFLGDKGTFPFRVTNSGDVWYHPTGVAKTRCKFDLTYYPFDVQVCSIIIESVVFQANELKLQARSDEESPNAVSFGMFAENEVWEIDYNQVGGISTVFRSGKHTAFSRIKFWMVIRRKPTFFVVTAVIPSIILGVITLLTYLVPVHYVERPSQSVTTVLTVAIFEVMVAEKLPDNSANCLLTIYLTVILCSSAINIFTTTMCLAIVDPGEYISAPWGIPNVARAVARFFRSTVHRKFPIIATKTIRAYDPRCGQETAARLANHDLAADDDCEETEHIVKEPHNNKRKTRTPSISMARAEEKDSRHMAASRKAWYVAYAINWIGFTVCLMATFSIPLYAYITVPKGKTRHSFNDTSNDLTAYYGD